MSRFNLSPSASLGSHVAAEGQADSVGVVVTERRDVIVCSVVARKGMSERLSERMRAAFGVEPPAKPKRVQGPAVEITWAGPGQWLVLGQGRDGRDFEHRLRDALGDSASVTDQSDGRAILRISGPHIRDTLAKGFHIDLDPRAFRSGDTAITAVAYINVHLWQVDDSPSYDVAMFRSFATAFYEWLSDSAAEYGIVTRAS